MAVSDFSDRVHRCSRVNNAGGTCWDYGDEQVWLLALGVGEVVGVSGNALERCREVIGQVASRRPALNPKRYADWSSYPPRRASAKVDN